MKPTLFSFTSTSYQLYAHLHRNDHFLYVSYEIPHPYLASLDFGSDIPDKKRRTNLWEKTCFELFLESKDGPYLEFNFSPQFSWNAFYFKDIRSPNPPEEWMMEPVEIEILRSAPLFKLMATISLKDIPFTLYRAGLTAVVCQENSNTKDYWALSHERDRPDFHCRESFKYTF